MEKVARSTSGDAAHEIVAVVDSFDALVVAWLADATSRCGVAEAKVLKSVSGRITRALGGRRIEQVTDAARQAYLDGLAREGKRQRTVDNHERVLARIFKLGVERGLVQPQAGEGAHVIPLVRPRHRHNPAPVDHQQQARAARQRPRPLKSAAEDCQGSCPRHDCPFASLGPAANASTVGQSPTVHAQASQAKLAAESAPKPKLATPPQIQHFPRINCIQVPLAKVASYLARSEDTALFDPSELLGEFN